MPQGSVFSEFNLIYLVDNRNLSKIYFLHLDEDIFRQKCHPFSLYTLNMQM